MASVGPPCLWSSCPVLVRHPAVSVTEPGPVPQPAAAARQPWTVGALLLATSDLLAARFGAVAVRGELSGFVRAASGHCYFALKDGGGAPALLRCAMFRRASGLLDFAPADGQQVELRGRLGVYDTRGELQVVVESMQRVGTGTLYEEFLRLKARLQAQGLFDAARKRPLPPYPAAVGVVTSLGAAALQDVLTALQRRAPQVSVVVYPAPVQGADAPAALAAAIALAGQRHEVDLLLLVRGTAAMTVLRGVGLVLLGALVLSQVFDLRMINWILRNSVTGLLIGMVIIFQPELRRALDLGVDVVGGIPHFERTMAEGAYPRFGVADLLASFELLEGDASRINQIDARFAAVTPEILLATAQEYLRPTNRNVLVLEAGVAE